jgi:hypothetical protein
MVLLRYKSLNNYEIWYKKPSNYGDSIKGELKFYENNKNNHRYKEKYSNIKKLIASDDLKMFADEHLYASHESTTYEWIEYRL